jgi:hypothetical protein
VYWLFDYLRWRRVVKEDVFKGSYWAWYYGLGVDVRLKNCFKEALQVVAVSILWAFLVIGFGGR